MATTEVDSFVTKLKHLWHSGYKACLKIEVCEGKASVTLAAEVGYALPPSSPVKGRGPSYRRRQERRKKAFGNNNEIKQEVNQTAEQAAFGEEYGMVNEDTAEEVDVLTNVSVEVPTEEVTGNHVENEITNVMDNDVDEAEVARDKLVEEVIVYAVPPSDIRQPAQDVIDVEQEIRKSLSSIGVNVLSIRHRTRPGGQYESSLVKLTPVNLNRIWGRRLGLKNCAVVEFKR